MNNAEKFESVFGLCATELWALSEESFLLWINSEYDQKSERKKGTWETVPWKIIEHGEVVVVVGDAQRCSVCRHAEKGWKKEMKYCPNCGSEMSRGDQ